MKVLFAVNNEHISDSIIKKYQQDYRELISSKNVYYFNALLKELQEDKSYDRIVIGEDLEMFSNNNYDVMDKFIFDKLDKISDEASNTSGEDIPIIFDFACNFMRFNPMLENSFEISEKQTRFKQIAEKILVTGEKQSRNRKTKQKFKSNRSVIKL